MLSKSAIRTELVGLAEYFNRKATPFTPKTTPHFAPQFARTRQLARTKSLHAVLLARPKPAAHRRWLFQHHWRPSQPQTQQRRPRLWLRLAPPSPTPGQNPLPTSQKQQGCRLFVKVDVATNLSVKSATRNRKRTARGNAPRSLSEAIGVSLVL